VSGWCLLCAVAGCEGLVFFFSSRRRHTSSKRDWSSDVCSSDLTLMSPYFEKEKLDPHLTAITDPSGVRCFLVEGSERALLIDTRSEERRVGKECRYGGSPQHQDQKTVRRAEARPAGRLRRCRAR